jgi:hypothetical protein
MNININAKQIEFVVSIRLYFSIKATFLYLNKSNKIYLKCYHVSCSLLDERSKYQYIVKTTPQV